MLQTIQSRHRRHFLCDGGDLSPTLLKVVVTVTITFSMWNLQFFKQGCIFSYKTILIFPYTLEFGQESRIFLATEAFCGRLKHAENAIAAGAPPRTPLGELTTLPQAP